MSHTLMRTNIFPVVDENPKTTLLLIDNFRYDQWRSISSLLRGWYDVAQDDFTAPSSPPPRSTPATPSSRGLCRWPSTA